MAKGKVVYEQSPWDKEHIESINHRLKGQLVSDGNWHTYSHPKGLAYYRVIDDRYFQGVYTKSDTATLNALMSISPVESEDDAEWTIWKEKDGYAITSVFTLTPGPFNYTGEVVEWLDRHSLGFEDDTRGIKGVAYFAEIETGCLADAMERLAWLENVILTLNQKINDLGREFWQDVKLSSDLIYSEVKDGVSPDEIIPTPVAYRPDGWKKREAVEKKDINVG